MTVCIFIVACSLMSLVGSVTDVPQKPLALWSEMILRDVLDVSALTELITVDKLRMYGQR